MNIKRKESEPPLATSEWGWRYHHIGIPTDKVIEGETYIPQFKLYVSGFNSSPYGIEWMRFDNDSPVHDLIKKVPHIAGNNPTGLPFYEGKGRKGYGSTTNQIKQFDGTEVPIQGIHP
jgi:hypothetical protein